LNMGSTDASSMPEGVDDRTGKARIRDAAIACFADVGASQTTARRVAAEAGVSPGLVMHHFGSMEGLRSACDDHVVETIRTMKTQTMSEGAGIDILAALRHTDVGNIPAYLARMLGEDTPASQRLIDEIVSDAETYLERGVESGMMRPSDDPRGRAAIMVFWSLGALMLHRHVERILGVDLTDPHLSTSPTLSAWAVPVYEILGEGILSEDFAANATSTFHAMSPTDSPTTDQPDRSKHQETER